MYFKFSERNIINVFKIKKKKKKKKINSNYIRTDSSDPREN